MQIAYWREDVGDDVDGGADEGGAEEDEEGQLGVEEVVPPSALKGRREDSICSLSIFVPWSNLEVTEVVPDDPDVDQPCE